MKKIILFLFLISCPILLIHAQYISTVAGNGYEPGGPGTGAFSGDGGLADSAELNNPSCIALDDSGNMYIADAANNRIRKVISKTGIITTIAGTNKGGYNGDGIAATAAELSVPFGIALDSSGNMYIADNENNRIRIVNAITGIIGTIAGNGKQGYSGDGGQATAAELKNPYSIALDNSGNIYVADLGNNCIRKINQLGIITTVAGDSISGYNGDGGQATAAKLNGPTGVSLDNKGNIYIADASNYRIRKVAATGIITTIAGNGAAGFSGDGGQATAAELKASFNTYIDDSGSIYIADFRIRKIETNGIINTIAGTGTLGYNGDGELATNAELSCSSICIDNSGDLYIADVDNDRIRKISSPLGINELLTNNDIHISPNPNNGKFAVQTYNSNKLLLKGKIDIYNVMGENIYADNFDCSVNKHFDVDLSNNPSGVYLYKISAENGEYVESGKLIIK